MPLTRRALLTGSAGALALLSTPVRAATRPEVTGVRFIHDARFPGEACAVMALRAQGAALTLDDVFDAAALAPASGCGVGPSELDRALRSLKTSPGECWHPLAGDERATVDRAWTELLAELREDAPVALYVGRGVGPQPGDGAFIVVLAARDDVVIFHDPARELGASRSIPIARLRERWAARDDDGARGIWLYRPRPAELALPSATSRRRARAYVEPATRTRERARALPGRFRVAVERPFVIATDGPASFHARYVTGTVRWAVEHLERDFFAREPSEVVVIWLFKSRASYVGNNKRLFRRAPFTPFGYYDPARHELVMNIATGTGTLTHELVHPYMAANFPARPPWFDEGLASLYEQPAERDGRMVGLTNWRLQGLQGALRRGRVRDIKALTASGQRFRTHNSAVNYAYARYLCYYLQERQLLRAYYHAFVARQAQDPTGYETLKTTLGADDDGMTEFQREWERFVLGLRYPQRR